MIGTDHQALRRMCEKKTDLPVLTVNTNGMELYDAGERKAYLELLKPLPGKSSLWRLEDRSSRNDTSGCQ